MALSNYSELKTEIESAIDDSSITGKIENFIKLAEDEIKADLNLVEMEAIATSNTTTTSHYLAFPSYFTSPIRMHINYNDEQYPITITTPEGLNQKWTDADQMPRYAAIVDGQFEFNCVSDQAYEVEILFTKLTSLDSTTNTTNEIFPTFLNCYYYGTLKHAALFLREDETIYERQYEINIRKLKRRDKKKRYPSPKYARSRYIN